MYLESQLSRVRDYDWRINPAMYQQIECEWGPQHIRVSATSNHDETNELEGRLHADLDMLIV